MYMYVYVSVCIGVLVVCTLKNLSLLLGKIFLLNVHQGRFNLESLIVTFVLKMFICHPQMKPQEVPYHTLVHVEQ